MKVINYQSKRRRKKEGRVFSGETCSQIPGLDQEVQNMDTIYIT